MEKFLNQNWYHQRFDGCPLLLSFIGEAETVADSRRPSGTEARHRLCFFENNKADWFLDQRDIDRGAEILLAKFESGEINVENLVSQWKQSETEFEVYFSEVEALELKLLTDQDLAAVFEKVRTLGTARFTSSCVIDHFALGTDCLLADLIRVEAGPFTSEKEFTACFSKLTAPVHQSFASQAEEELQKIALDVKVKNLSITTELTALQQFTAKYFWLKNNYIRTTPSQITDFLLDLELIAARNTKENEAEYNRLKHSAEKNKQNKIEILKTKKLSTKLINLLSVSEIFTAWQDERKRATLLTAHIVGKIISEMAKRKFTSAELVKYLLTNEVSNWFLQDSITNEILNERRKKSVVIWEQNETQVLTGELVQKLAKMVYGEEDYTNINDIRGLVATPGRAIGPVKLIMSATEINKVEPGDILVAVMTRPDYLPAMKRAAAIVTDEGGVTSHAAIVSRELNVPCVIGTKIATRIFHDGEMVEVNANHGVIKKIK